MTINNLRVAIIGAGVIGSGWIARFSENGIDVSIYDPAPDAEDNAARTLENAERAYSKLTMAPRANKGNVRFVASLDEAVRDAGLIVEAVPEELTLKKTIYAEVEKTAATDAIIASSTSGILPTELQHGMAHPDRLLVAHPFNPVYLLPLVELIGGKDTATEVIDRAVEIYTDLGMRPLHIKKEIEAFVADRLLEAVWRESLWLIKDGIATTEEIDDAIRFGFGLRWAQMGLFDTYRLAGGEAGMRHFIAQFGPCLQWPWTKLMDVPELTEELIDLISSQSDAQSGHYSIRELERIRDDNLVAILQALKLNNWGAGETLAHYEKKRFDAGVLKTTSIDLSQPIRTLERQVPTDWTDYNNHMNESRYLQCFADASDTLLRLIGVDAEYVDNNGSYFTVETHIRHIDEVAALQPIYITTQIITAGGKKLHLFHRLYHDSDRLLATGEHLLIHVNLETRSASEPTARVSQLAMELARAHVHLETPEGAGRAVGQPL
ncbi:MAG: carnitine 3-dehydrogenase [Gammaproteobacteria bacterium]